MMFVARQRILRIVNELSLCVSGKVISNLSNPFLPSSLYLSFVISCCLAYSIFCELPIILRDFSWSWECLFRIKTTVASDTKLFYRSYLCVSYLLYSPNILYEKIEMKNVGVFAFLQEDKHRTVSSLLRTNPSIFSSCTSILRSFVFTLIGRTMAAVVCSAKLIKNLNFFIKIYYIRGNER